MDEGDFQVLILLARTFCFLARSFDVYLFSCSLEIADSCLLTSISVFSFFLLDLYSKVLRESGAQIYEEIADAEPKGPSIPGSGSAASCSHSSSYGCCFLKYCCSFWDKLCLLSLMCHRLALLHMLQPYLSL
jgi:hypothetical protein